MAVNVNDIAITSLETITAFDYLTGAYSFTLDELQNASLENTEDTQDVTGKGGRLLTQLKRNKGLTVSGSNGLVSGGLLSAQTGGDFKNQATTVMWTDYLTVTDNKATTTYTAVGTAGAEIRELHIRNNNGTLGADLEQADTAAEGKFAYDPKTKALTFVGLANCEIVVIYDRKITADVLQNVADVYSKKCALYLDALGEDKCGNVYRIQFFMPKCEFSGQFTIEFGDNQTTHDFEAKTMTGACVSGSASTIWTYTIFGVDTKDAT